MISWKKKINALVNNDKMEVFVNPKVKNIEIITLRVNEGRLAALLRPHIKKTLLKKGINVLSMKAAQNRLLELEKANNGVNINGSSKIINSNLIIDITVNDWNGQMEVEILDLANDGSTLGFLNYKTGMFKPEVVGPAMILKIFKAIEEN
ncbi:MAG: hypothetical protein ACJ0QO_01315 [Parvicellaceae bacterium]